MKRILIVDDHAVLRRGLLDLLRHEYVNLYVGEAKDAREAVGLLLNQDWDLVILDINMPGPSGLEVLTEIRRLARQTPALVLSAYPEQEIALRAFQLGAAGYLNKQTAFDELLVAVRRILGGGKYVTSSLAERMAATLGREIQAAPHEALSARELQVLRLIAMGRTLKEISTELTVSEKTVATYRARISEKMQLGTKVELTRYALQNKLVE
jgi:two-component system, NarL family, invasion response regulator UvrY